MQGAGWLNRLSRSLALGAEVATRRFSVAALLILVIAVFANMVVADQGFLSDDDLFRLFAALYGGVAAAVGARLAAESHGSGANVRLLAPALAAALIGLLIWNARVFGLFAPALAIAVTLAVPLAPYVSRPDAGRFWAFTLWTLVGTTLAFLSVLLFVLGVSAILEMVRFLFDVGLGSRAYEHLYTTALTLVGPLFALGRIPSDYDEAPPVPGKDKLAAGVRLLFDWVASPLALTTALVLHAYAAKIVLLSQWPVNEIGWIVSLFAILVLSLRIAAEPFVRSGLSSTRLFGRLWAPILVVPLALLAYAVTVRLRSEGVTLERYYLALGGLATGAAVAAQLVPRLRGDIRLVAGIPLVLLALSSWGPWSVAETVGRSQTGRLVAEFADASPNGTWNGMTVDSARKDSLRSRIRALDEVDELGRIVPLLPADKREAIAASIAGASYSAEDEVVASLGLDYGGPSEPASLSFSAARPQAFDIGGYDTEITERYAASGSAAEPVPGDARLALEAGDLVVTFRGNTDRIGLAPVLGALTKEQFSADPQTLDPLVLDLKTKGGRSARLRVNFVLVDQLTRQVISLSLATLLRGAEWPAQPSSLGGQPLSRDAEPAGAVGEGAR